MIICVCNVKIALSKIQYILYNKLWIMYDIKKL